MRDFVRDVEIDELLLCLFLERFGVFDETKSVGYYKCEYTDGDNTDRRREKLGRHQCDGPRRPPVVVHDVDEMRGAAEENEEREEADDESVSRRYVHRIMIQEVE